MKTKSLTILAALSVAAILNVNAADTFVSFTRNADNQLQLTQTTDTIVYADADWEGVKIAVRNLRADLKTVTGSEYAPIIVGTVGKSPIANNTENSPNSLKASGSSICSLQTMASWLFWAPTSAEPYTVSTSCRAR